jgi:hypothetical protein
MADWFAQAGWLAYRIANQAVSAGRTARSGMRARGMIRPKPPRVGPESRPDRVSARGSLVTKTCHVRSSTSAADARSSGCAQRWSGGQRIMRDVLLAAGVLDSQLPRADLAGAIGYPVLRDRDVDQASPLRPPIIWPRLSTARMPSINTGARVAAITNKFTTTTVLDAK